MFSGPRSTVRRARSLRRSMSLPEVLLWRELRKRPSGLKFRRQHAAGKFVSDFYCHSAQLVIEIDGESHNRGEAAERDRVRDQTLAQQDLRTLRIPARDVLDNLEGTLTLIVSEARGDCTPPPAFGWSPSPQGEDC